MTPMTKLVAIEKTTSLILFCFPLVLKSIRRKNAKKQLPHSQNIQIFLLQDTND